jgi:hypothetical protein
MMTPTTTPKKTRLTPQKLHKVIQAKIGVLSSKWAPSQRIDRNTYDVCVSFRDFIGVMARSEEMILAILEACKEAGFAIYD